MRPEELLGGLPEKVPGQVDITRAVIKSGAPVKNMGGAQNPGAQCGNRASWPAGQAFELKAPASIAVTYRKAAIFSSCGEREERAAALQLFGWSTSEAAE